MEVQDMVLTDELCDWLSATAREKSRGLEIDISFAVCNEHGLSQMYRQYSRALVLSVTMEAGGRPLLLLGILKREGRECGRRRGFDAPADSSRSVTGILSWKTQRQCGIFVGSMVDIWSWPATIVTLHVKTVYDMMRGSPV